MFKFTPGSIYKITSENIPATSREPKPPRYPIAYEKDSLIIILRNDPFLCLDQIKKITPRIIKILYKNQVCWFEVPFPYQFKEIK